MLGLGLLSLGVLGLCVLGVGIRIRYGQRILYTAPGRLRLCGCENPISLPARPTCRSSVDILSSSGQLRVSQHSRLVATPSASRARPHATQCRPAPRTHPGTRQAELNVGGTTRQTAYTSTQRRTPDRPDPNGAIHARLCIFLSHPPDSRAADRCGSAPAQRGAPETRPQPPVRFAPPPTSSLPLPATRPDDEAAIAYSDPGITTSSRPSHPHPSSKWRHHTQAKSARTHTLPNPRVSSWMERLCVLCACA